MQTCPASMAYDIQRIRDLVDDAAMLLMMQYNCTKIAGAAELQLGMDQHLPRCPVHACMHAYVHTCRCGI